MKILVIGGGGREHALCWKLSKGGSAEKIFCAPGNAGIAGVAECVPISDGDVKGLRDFAERQNIDLVIVGPELPLTRGAADSFKEAGIKVFGPAAYAAQLEGSKFFAKDFMREMSIPTADFADFTEYEPARAYLESAAYPLVIKADGLAAGKGVLVTSSKDEAQDFLKSLMLDGAHGGAGARIVVEECLVGEETSILAVCDGRDMVILTPSQDHKRAYDNDEGPNTGGMGAYSPVSIVTPALIETIREQVLQRVADGMKKRGTPFVGVIYAGMMLTAAGPKTLEFNVRFGDPEAQVVLPLIEGDLAQICLAAAEGRLAETKWEPARRTAMCVVMASGGYPGSYEKGKPINGLEAAGALDDVVVFHAGTAAKDGRIVTAGGRVLGVTGIGANLKEASDKAYDAVRLISWEGERHRTDIGKRDLARIN